MRLKYLQPKTDSLHTFPFSCLLMILTLLLAATPLLADESRLLRPALSSDRAISSLLLDITAAGDRLVAVGERGHILYRDPGQAWQQAPSPVIAHLTGVDFVTPQLGFAVGHEAIILRTRDAGASWELVNQDTEEPPLLDIHFISETTGFAVGGYNQLLMTEDAGDSWSFIGDRLPNPDEYHNNAIIQHPDGGLFIAGERGNLFRSDDRGEQWQQLPLDYDGSLFGLFVTTTGDLVATGLRGNLFISQDRGDQWQALTHEGEQTLNGGLALADDQLLLVGQNGEYLSGPADALEQHSLPGRDSLLAVIRQGNEILAVGRGGVHPLPALQSAPQSANH